MNDHITEIIFLLDRSGSMAGLERDTIGGFNTMVQKQSQLEGETYLTTVLFDHCYEILWNGVKAQDVTLTEEDYFVRGSTALLDAVGKTIIDVGYRLSQTREEKRPGKVIFVITTDGLENASREFTYEKVRELINRQQEKYNWEFIFMGANIDAVKEADSIGIKLEHAFNFESTSVGVEEMYNVIAEVVTEIRDK
ncbi:vWA domain-containing protein [Bacillus sp. Marseille-P3661]|uniref:vWA domain-containing protein n=1 Tax=Bacillus sp. Marseille-P3661 TaxID=1936234 RepID=UPI000C818DB6|nr:hypothetical protein [Bacillus sp. Marseille-P3661]